MAREQLFFVGSDNGQPVLLALILQWQPDKAGAIIEAKSFLVWRGELRAPFYERKQLTRWPGSTLGPAARAWADAGGRSRRVRVGWSDNANGFRFSLRRPAGALILDARQLRSAGTGKDPHGDLAWRSGPATLRVNGRDVAGVAIVERLASVRTPWPHFGRFEMWLTQDGMGQAVLGRCRFESAKGPCVGKALVAGPNSAKTRVLIIRETSRRTDSVSGFALPTVWHIVAPDLGKWTRAGGKISRGETPDGGPAAYDIGVARNKAGAALVFHIQDTAR